MVLTHLVPEDVLTLADLLLPEWPAARERIRLSGHPTCDGDDVDSADDDGDADTTDADTDDAAANAGDDDDDADSADDGAAAEPDWKKMARKHEREAKAARKRETELQAKLKAREDADKTEQQKAIDQAREDATAEVTTKFEASQRDDRIENAVTKLSLKGFKVKDADGKEVTLRFADPDDAQLRLDRALRNDEVSYDELYTDGKVQTPALTAFLTDLLQEHPRLRADPPKNTRTDADVDFDGGKGSGGGAKDLDELSPEDHLKQIQKR